MIYLRQIITHENKHVKISKEVAEKYLKPAEQEMSAQKAKGVDKESCFRQLCEKIKPLGEKALSWYNLVERSASHILDKEEGVKTKRFLWFEYLAVEGDFDINAFLRQFPPYGKIKGK